MLPNAPPLLSILLLMSVKMSPGRIPKPLSLEPGGGNKGGRQSMVKRPQRDLELPMSPIGHSSSLEFMDTSTVLSETFEKMKSSGKDGAREPPRVSTQKIPHRTLLESFGPPKIKVSAPSPHPSQKACSNGPSDGSIQL